jgi:hypothetical protein
MLPAQERSQRKLVNSKRNRTSARTDIRSGVAAIVQLRNRIPNVRRFFLKSDRLCRSASQGQKSGKEGDFNCPAGSRASVEVSRNFECPVHSGLMSSS